MGKGLSQKLRSAVAALMSGETEPAYPPDGVRCATVH